jgi:sulfotransferase family protein
MKSVDPFVAMNGLQKGDMEVVSILKEIREQTVRDSKLNPYVFIVGCQRSGTTLLRRILSAHLSVAITPETHWITRYFERGKCLTSEGLVTPRLVKRLLAYHRFNRLQIGREEVERFTKSDPPASYSAFVTAVFNLYGSAQGKQLVGDKTPAYVRSIPTLHKFWPQARFVHLIRDGRDVCLSIMNWGKAENSVGHCATWIEDPISTIALWWKLNVRLGREAGSSLGSKLYFEMRYEDLIANPERECQELCRFLEVPYDDAMLRFHEGRTKLKPGLSAKKAWLPITPGLRDWRTQMAAEDVERFEAAAGDLLDELGYARAVSNPTPEARRHASSIYEVFTQDVRSRRGQRVPKGW